MKIHELYSKELIEMLRKMLEIDNKARPSAE